jgi:Cu/Ag efflux protein CusF
MTNRSKTWIAAAVALSAQVAFAQTQPDVQVTKQPGQAHATRSAKVTATVTAVDPATRTVTLKGKDGKVKEVAMGAEVRNFDQLKVGDVVQVEYKEALALSLKKDGGPPASAAQKETVSRAAPGAKPGGSAAREVTVTADVVAVNPSAKTVTLRGPAGNLVDMMVEDPAQLKGIKKGDQVQAVYTEALAVSVMPKGKK